MAKEIGNFSSLLVSLSERACLVFAKHLAALKGNWMEYCNNAIGDEKMITYM